MLDDVVERKSRNDIFLDEVVEKLGRWCKVVGHVAEVDVRLTGRDSSSSSAVRRFTRRQFDEQSRGCGQDSLLLLVLRPLSSDDTADLDQFLRSTLDLGVGLERVEISRMGVEEHRRAELSDPKRVLSLEATSMSARSSSHVGL